VVKYKWKHPQATKQGSINHATYSIGLLKLWP
jgi:hypothetical protein